MVVSVENKNLVVAKKNKRKKNQNMQCTIVRKQRFTDKQEASGKLNSLELKTPLTKIPVLGEILF